MKKEERKIILYKNIQNPGIAYMAELLQHLLAVGQVRSHELGSIHFDLLFHFPGGQARLEEDRRKPLTTELTSGTGSRHNWKLK